MVVHLALLRSWQIVAFGVVAWLAAMAAVTFVAHLCYEAFPDGYAWVAAGHIIIAGLVGWCTPSPFLQAYWLRKVLK